MTTKETTDETTPEVEEETAPDEVVADAPLVAGAGLMGSVIGQPVSGIPGAAQFAALVG